MTNYELLEKLADKIPSARMLLDSRGYRNTITISERDQVYSINVIFRKEVFFDFCRNNKIFIGNALKSAIDKYRLMLVNIDSLLTDTYRIYFSRENFLYDIEYQEYNKFPIGEIDIKKCYDLAKNYIDNYIQNNEIEFHKRVELADVGYPIVLSIDDLGSYDLVDGAHRIYKLYHQGQKTASARIIPIRDRLNLVDNVFFSKEFKFEDQKVNSAFLKVKSNFNDCDHFVWRKFSGLGIYYNKVQDQIPLYKFYFRSDTNMTSQYKVDGKNNYIGKFDEAISKNDDLFVDTKNIKDLFVDKKIVSSHKRFDVDQSHLTVKI